MQFPQSDMENTQEGLQLVYKRQTTRHLGSCKLKLAGYSNKLLNLQRLNVVCAVLHHSYINMTHSGVAHIKYSLHEVVRFNWANPPLKNISGHFRVCSWDLHQPAFINIMNE